MEDRGCIESPGRLRELIEAVYGGEAEENLPSGLQNLLFDAEGRSGAERSVATTNALKLDQGYVRDGGAWDSDLRTPTRIADVPQTTLRLARIDGGRIGPYAEDTEDWRAWRLSEVQVAAGLVGGDCVSSEVLLAAREAREAWGRFDGDKALIVLEEVADRGFLSMEDAQGSRWSYDPDRGLALVAST